jgi:hypothetical protein
MRNPPVLMKQQNQAGPLPELILDRSLSNDLLAVGNKRWREIGAIL